MKNALILTLYYFLCCVKFVFAAPADFACCGCIKCSARIPAVVFTCSAARDAAVSKSTAAKPGAVELVSRTCLEGEYATLGTV